jgi:hypothetical protein
MTDPHSRGCRPTRSTGTLLLSGPAVEHGEPTVIARPPDIASRRGAAIARVDTSCNPVTLYRKV